MVDATQMTRRSVIAGAAAAAALTPFAAHLPARADAPQSSKQAPGFYRYKVGEIEITAVTDGAFANPLTDTFIRNVKKDDVNKALEAMYLAKDQVTVPYTPIVVNTGSKLVVIDTGLGPAMYEQRKGIVGQFHTNLAAAGIDRNTVDTVVISHFHGDHINGLLTADSKPAFPKAEVMVPSGEWKFWNDAGEESKAAGNALVEGDFKNIRRVFGALGNKVTRYEPGKEVVPGITSMATFGHTPGHVSHIITSGKAKLMVQADVTNVPLFVQNPGWFIQFDMDPVAAEATRRKFYDMLVAEKMLVQGFHYPFPSVGHVEKAGSGYRIIPVPWSPTI
jgi:glyoxylase-like metal-dependent hydrolase (beta-lactamase superfamily II)